MKLHRPTRAQGGLFPPHGPCQLELAEPPLVAKLFDLFWPERFGGGGERSAVTGALVAEELACGDLSIALGIHAHVLSNGERGAADRADALVRAAIGE